MAINETISKGNKYRRLKDNVNKVWQRISFWTAASDVEFDNGQTAQEALGNITGITDSLTSNSSAVAASANAVSQLNSKITSFQVGVNALYEKLVALGVTPTDNSLSAITNAMQKVNDNAYNGGYQTGYNQGYSSGTNDGVSAPLSQGVTISGTRFSATIAKKGSCILFGVCDKNWGMGTISVSNGSATKLHEGHGNSNTNVTIMYRIVTKSDNCVVSGSFDTWGENPSINLYR